MHIHAYYILNLLLLWVFMKISTSLSVVRNSFLDLGLTLPSFLGKPKWLAIIPILRGKMVMHFIAAMPFVEVLNTSIMQNTECCQSSHKGEQVCIWQERQHSWSFWEWEIAGGELQKDHFHHVAMKMKQDENFLCFGNEQEVFSSNILLNSNSLC